MKKLFITSVLATTLFIGSMSANASCPCKNKDGMMPPPPPPFEHMQKKLTPEQKAQMEKKKAEMDKRLGITEEQKAQLKAIHEQSKQQIAPKIKKLTEIEYELAVLEKREINAEKYGVKTLENVKLSGKSVEQLRKEQRTLRDEIRAIKMANFEKSQNVFTDKQKKELEKMKKEHEKEMSKMHKNHQPPKHFE